MSFTRELGKVGGTRLLALAAAFGLAVMAWSAIGGADAHHAALETATNAAAQAGGSDPEANLPFLFAVYIITWAAFFGYAFYVSRRQRDMQGEIDALRRALEDRDRQSTGAEN